jgi:uncharacterized membrane protein YfcA
MKFLFVLLIGVVAGLIGALCGVGGGIVIVPALVKGLGFDQKNAVATSLAIIIIIAISATINNQRAAGSLIDWRVVLVVGFGAALAAWFGSAWMRELSSPTLTRLFGIVLLIIGSRMLWKP